MRVNVYVDGFNLYRGAAELAGNSSRGWKWLDIRSLSGAIAAMHWQGATIGRVVYCTARVKPLPTNPDQAKRQEVYLAALKRSGSVDWIEYGYLIEKFKRRPAATDGGAGKPVVTMPVLMVGVADREEKGSDVNVATHLLLDALSSPPAMDAAIVISNDSDLKMPVVEARKRMPVGIVNPGRAYTSGALTSRPQAGGIQHWEYRLQPQLLAANQLPQSVGAYTRPPSW